MCRWFNSTLGHQLSAGYPIKRARRALQAHPYYDGFVNYGDAEAYRRELEALRTKLAQLDAAEKE